MAGSIDCAEWPATVRANSRNSSSPYWSRLRSVGCEASMPMLVRLGQGQLDQVVALSHRDLIGGAVALLDPMIGQRDGGIEDPGQLQAHHVHVFLDPSQGLDDRGIAPDDAACHEVNQPEARRW